MGFLRERHRQPELMDQPGLAESEHAAALAGLRRVNLLSTGVGQLWSHLRKLAETNPGQAPLRVLDLACGSGDVAIRLARRAQRHKLPMVIHGCDVSSTALRIAQQSCEHAGVRDVEFFPLDAIQSPIPAGYDVVMCSLFLHHLPNDEALGLIRAMAASARRAILIDDLLRTYLGYALCWVGCQILTRSPIVHVDGPLSVQGAFTRHEVQALAESAGLQGARIKRHWPQRFLLSWERP